MTRRTVFGIFCLMFLMSMFTTQCASYILCVRFYNAVDSKRGTCSSASKDKSQQIKTCEENLSLCSDEDREIVNEAVSCIEKMKNCQGGLGVISWGTEYLSCTARFLSFSSVCGKAFVRN